MEEYKLIKFLFETNNGPGHATMAIAPGQSVEDVGQYLLAMFEKCYTTVELTGYEEVTRQ